MKKLSQLANELHVSRNTIMNTVWSLGLELHRVANRYEVDEEQESLIRAALSEGNKNSFRANRKSEVQTLQEQLVVKDCQISTLISTFEDQLSKISEKMELQSELSRKQQEIESLRKDVSEKETEIAGLESTLQEKEKELAYKDSQIEQRDNELHLAYDVDKRKSKRYDQMFNDIKNISLVDRIFRFPSILEEILKY